MALHNVRNLVGNDPGELSFIVCRLDRSHIHEDRPTGKSKGVDLFLVHDVEAVRPLLSGRM